MIRLVQRKLIIPRGDTGTFSVPVLPNMETTGNVAVFTIFDPKTLGKIYQKIIETNSEIITIDLEHNDTVNLPVGNYLWDIKFYKDPVFADENLINGVEVDSYYAAYKLPECEVRLTGDNLLTANDAPNTTLTPSQLNIINAALTEIQGAKTEVARDAETATSAVETVVAAKNAATNKAGEAAASATAAEAAQGLAEAAQRAAASSADSAAAASNEIKNLTVETSTLEEGSNATASYSSATGVMSLGIPRGDTGNGIASVVQNNDTSLTITYTNGNSITTVPLKGEQGDAFHIVKTYASVAAMNADYSGNDVQVGEFVMIASNVEDPDNARVYVKGNQQYNFIVDMSGSAGIQGPQGNTPSISIGTVSTLIAGSNATATITGTTTNPVLNLGIPRGAIGNTGVGIENIAKTETNGLVDTYTITLSSGATKTFTVTNGSRITGMQKTGTSGLVDTYTISFSDGTSGTFTVTNGTTPNFTIGTVTTDAQASATITGTADAPVLNLVLPQGEGVPSGGTTGQVLKKKSGTDYDTEWGNEPSVPVTDVQIDGVSIVDGNGVAKMLVKSYTTIMDDVVTTSTDDVHLNPYAVYAGKSINERYKYRVTVDGVSTESDVAVWYQDRENGGKGIGFFGNINIFDSDMPNIYKNDASKNYCILYREDLGIGLQITTTVAGTHTIKIERISYSESKLPDTLIYGDNNPPINRKYHNNSSYQSIEIGNNNATNARGTVAIGNFNNTTTEFGIAIGMLNNVSGQSAIALGSGNTASGAASNANGKRTTSSGNYSFAEGMDTVASGQASHAEGVETIASGSYSHSEGLQTKATGAYSHSEGYKTQAKKAYSHVEGASTIADANCSHAEGYASETSGLCSHAEGYGTKASGEGQHTEGKYNILDSYALWPEWVANTSYQIGDKVKVTTTSNGTTTVKGYICKTANSDSSFTSSKWTADSAINFAHIVGNGTADNARSNAYALTWEGDGHYAGDVYVHSNADSGGGTKLATINDIPSVPVQDVQIDGVSVVSGSVAEIPIASGSNLGLVKTAGTGIYVNATGEMSVVKATSAQIKAATANFVPIVPSNQHESTFYGLAKAAGDTSQSQSNNAVGAYTDTAKSAIQNMFGVDNLIAPRETSYVAQRAYAIGDLFMLDGKLYHATAAIAQDGAITEGTNCEAVKLSEVVPHDVQVNGTSIVNNGVANVPVASTTNLGVVYVAGGGLAVNSSTGQITCQRATDEEIKVGTNTQKPIVPITHGKATFYGLAKASGDTTQSQSDNPVGTYTDTAKASIQHMLGTDINLAACESDTTADAAYAIGELFMLNGKLHQATAVIAIGDTLEVGTNCSVVNVASVFPHDVQVNGTTILNNGVANVPVAAAGTWGVTQPQTDRGIATTNGKISISPATETHIKGGDKTYSPICTSRQHNAVFYGLAKAAGDTTQSASSNAVGSYTTSAKNAIHQMLGTADLIEVGFVEEVTGTTPSITGQANYRYNCGELSTLSITPPSAGSIDVYFTSGSTATVLTVPNTVKWPAWFDATALDSNTIYELLITDGVYGSVMSWAT